MRANRTAAKAKPKAEVVNIAMPARGEVVADFHSPAAGDNRFACGQLGLAITGHDLDDMGLIGILLLIGIVNKNAIMMTTMAALLGALPLALAQGAGSELRVPLGVAMVFGLTLSQALTLFTTPVVYLYLSALARNVGEAPLHPEISAAAQ